MQVSNNEVTFTPMYFVFLEQDTYHCHMGFRLLDENNNAAIYKDILSTVIK